MAETDLIINQPIEDISPFLRPTFFIDSDHESIASLASELVDMSDPPEARAEAVFNFVRDDIKYDFGAKVHQHEYVASYVLEKGKGYCVQKAILLCALGRAANVPVALVHSNLVDHTLPPAYIKKLGTNVMYSHGLNAFYLDGKFILADATLSPDVVGKRGYRKTGFDPGKDNLIPATTPDGSPHAEYLKFHGLFSEFDHERMVKKLILHYAIEKQERIAGKG